MNLKLSASAIAFLAMTGAASAGDLRPSIDDQGTEYFGNVFIGAGIETGRVPAVPSGVGIDVQIPRVDFGGKFAFDPVDGSTGFQLDANGAYSDMGLAFGTNTVSGSVIKGEAMAHITHGFNDHFKFGGFFGVESQNLTFNSTTNPGLSRVLNADASTIGVEGLYVFSDQTWLQGHVGLVDMNYLSDVNTMKTPNFSSTVSDFFGAHLGYGAGASVNHTFNQNFGVRGDIAYTNFTANAVNPNFDILSTKATLQYTMDTMPLTFAISAGHDSTSWYTDGGGSYNGDLKIQWSFGGPSEGTRGKLFRTNVLGLTP